MLEYTLDRRLTGGLPLIAHKRRSITLPIMRGPLPRRLVLPMQQHRGSPAEPCVRTGRKVLKGETIARPGPAPSAAVHAPTSGRVSAIEERLVATGTGTQPLPCIVIDSDGEDQPLPDDAASEWPASRSAQLERIREAGLVGLGGAVFPTAEKLASCGACEVLIINGAECEPYISCDDVLMREAAEGIVDGALLMTELLDARLCIIAIEQDKPAAIAAVADTARRRNDQRLRLADLPTVYPAGGELQLIEVLTGREVPGDRYPSDIGVISQNVATAYALHRLARHREPLLSRIVTVTGWAVAAPQNVEVLLGTPVNELIEHCGGYVTEPARLILGGTMMGIALPTDEVPITKASNCIVAAAHGEVREDYREWPCIRCGECAGACPARLLPQEILRAAKNASFESMEPLGLDACIECGCCDVVCPSHIPLTEYFRQTKRAFARYQRTLDFSAESEQRFQQRERRRVTEQQAMDSRRNEMKNRVLAGPESRREAIEAARERVRRKKPGSDQAAD